MSFDLRTFQSALATVLIAAPGLVWSQSPSMPAAPGQSEALREAAQASGTAHQSPPGDDEPRLPLKERLLQAADDIKIDEIVTLPIRSLKAVYSEGQIYYMSENGRYVLVGELLDIWQNKRLDTIDQVRDSVERLHFDNLRMPITELNTLTLPATSADAPVVNIFIDSESEASRQLITDARALTQEFEFNFIVVPALGPDSRVAAQRVSCTSDRGAALQAFEEGNTASLPVDPDCDMKLYSQTLIAASLMGINGIPFIVAPNGLIGRGRPDDLRAWLQERMQ